MRICWFAERQWVDCRASHSLPMGVFFVPSFVAARHSLKSDESLQGHTVEKDTQYTLGRVILNLLRSVCAELFL